MSEQQAGGPSPGELRPGAVLPELRVTPDKYLPHRYAGASRDFNPIHIDPDYAKQAGLPGNILHGLYSMSLVARAHTGAAGDDPRALRRLSVEFRGMGVPEQELLVTARVRERDGEVARTEATVTQQGSVVIDNAEAELRVG